MRLFGLIGYPLTHSFSKEYFSRKFEQEGLTDCRYELFPIKNIEGYTALLGQNPSLEGLNVTIPYKKSVISFLDDANNLPAGLPACNCIRIHQGKTEGFNTDYTAFQKSLVPLLQAHHMRAMILGNGGATEAVKYVLQKLGIPYLIVSRKESVGSVTYETLNTDMIREHKLIINTTPLGMYPGIDALPVIPYDGIGKDHLLYDLVYNPAITAFLQKGIEQGAVIKNGEEMLILQAEESWKIWNS